MLRIRTLFACSVLLLALILVGCSNENSEFQDILAVDDEIADFERLRLPGQSRVMLKVVEVTGDMIHPEFIARWTNLKREIEVDFYVLRLEDFDDPEKHPSQYENVFWSSLPSDGVVFGDRRPTTIHLHPSPGRWVMFFFNPADRAPGTEAELSADVRLSYFR